jgi:hypothetical protein
MIGSGTPPSDDTRRSCIPRVSLSENTIVPSSPHEAPRSSMMSQMTAEAPPLTATFFSLKSAEKPTH